MIVCDYQIRLKDTTDSLKLRHFSFPTIEDEELARGGTNYSPTDSSASLFCSLLATKLSRAIRRVLGDVFLPNVSPPKSFIAGQEI